MDTVPFRRGRVRRELKFYINQAQRVSLRRVVSQALTCDPHCTPGRGYFVRSLYFDNQGDTGYFDKLAGVGERKKYRLRVYEPGATSAKVEVKARAGDWQVKEGAVIPASDARMLQNGRYECLLKYNDEALNRIYWAFKTQHLRPVVLVEYWREAYYYANNTVRVTFDRDLRSSDTALDVLVESPLTIPIGRPGRLILEIKYTRFIPDWLSDLLRLSSFERCAISKYCLSRNLPSGWAMSAP